jgi:hypothetical protein
MDEPGHTTLPALPPVETGAGLPAPGLPPPALLPAGGNVNELAELVADLIELTGLVAVDRLAAARSRAGRGSLAQALIEEGLASQEGVARARAERYHLPFVDVLATHVEPQAVEQIPMTVLERTQALPYELDGNALRVAIVDPADIAGIDELRLATRLSVELAVAARDDLLAELKRFGRASEALGARAGIDLGEI